MTLREECNDLSNGPSPVPIGLDLTSSTSSLSVVVSGVTKSDIPPGKCMIMQAV